MPDQRVLTEPMAFDVEDMLASKERAVLVGRLQARIKATGKITVTQFALVPTIAVALGPPGIACLFSGTAYLQAFAFLMLLHLVAQFEIVRSLGRTTIWLISAERQQACLNEQLSEICGQLEDANRRLTQLSSTDGLTGLYNRMAFDNELITQWSLAYRRQSWLALLMIDADQFKRFNDRHGHLMGDEALRWMAQVFAAAIHRPVGFVGRYGGEEFAVLLPEMDMAGAVAAGDRIRQALAEAEIPGAMPASSRLTVSIGAAAAKPAIEGSCLTLVQMADQALYTAKRAGRDRVAVVRAAVAASA